MCVWGFPVLSLSPPSDPPGLRGWKWGDPGLETALLPTRDEPWGVGGLFWGGGGQGQAGSSHSTGSLADVGVTASCGEGVMRDSKEGDDPRGAPAGSGRGWAAPPAPRRAPPFPLLPALPALFLPAEGKGHKEKLELVASFSFFGNVMSMASVQLAGAKRDALLLSFKDAKVGWEAPRLSGGVGFFWEGDAPSHPSPPSVSSSPWWSTTPAPTT